MDDAELIERLRGWAKDIQEGSEAIWAMDQDLKEAADRIEALKAERDRYLRHLTAGAESIKNVEAERDAARDAALEKAAKVAAGQYRSHSQYSPESVFYGIDLTPDRSDWGRGIQRGREEAAAVIRALKGKSHE